MTGKEYLCADKESSKKSYTHELYQFTTADDMTVDHIEYLQFLAV